MESKYKGIDTKRIKCCCDDPECAEAGISFEENMLLFTYLEIIPGTKRYYQITKSMYLNKQTRKEIIKQLRSLNLKS